MKQHRLPCYLYIIILFLMNGFTSYAAPDVNISYTVTFPEAQAHYADIEMDIKGLSQNYIDLKMPVWTPGSYLIREFSKNVESLVADAAGKQLPVVKVRKNIWRVTLAGNTNIKVCYRLYAFEKSVRTSFIDESHAFLGTSGMFMYPEGMINQPSIIHIVPYKGWSKVSTSLESVNNDPFTLYAPNYDILFDSPVEVGNQDVFSFDATGVHYEVCMYGSASYDRERLKKDMKRIVEEETAIYGENPNKRYVFIIHNYSKGGGGLEHLSSTVLGVARNAYASESGYQGFLGLVAHEHFHLWNVKRLRPIALGPFDYDNENYTTDLWIAEGFTAYFDNLVVHRTGLYTAENYLGILGADINMVENQPGKKIQPLAQASYDAWIKAYRPDENTVNTTISYYNKGSVIAMLLDLEIINDSKGQKSLDDVMRYMYNEYYKTKGRGYTDAEFKQALELFTGKNLDEFYQKYVYGVASIDYNKYLGYAGYQLTDQLAGTDNPSLGVKITTIDGRIFVNTVLRDGAGWKGGLNVNDEISAIDGQLAGDAGNLLAGKKTGDKVVIGVVRDGLPVTLNVTLQRDDTVKFKIESVSAPTHQQLLVRRKWLGL